MTGYVLYRRYWLADGSMRGVYLRHSPALDVWSWTAGRVAHASVLSQATAQAMAEYEAMRPKHESETAFAIELVPERAEIDAVAEASAIRLTRKAA